MSQKRSLIYQFWQELRRRKVLRSLAIYGGSAFIILEAATIIFPRWGFPDWTIDLVLYLLILGALINLVVAWIFDITPEGVQKTKPLAEVGESKTTTDSNAWKVATYISLVVIVALIVFNVVPMKKASAGIIDSLVILPFDNFTGDDQLDNMVSSMHSLLIGDVGRIGGLRVISKTSSNIYKNMDMSVPAIASELGVNAVMESTVMCLGDTICLQVKVITPFPEEKLLWIADFREEKGQMLNLYNRITKQIAEEVKIELSPDEAQRLTASRTVDPEALDAYLKGQFHWERLSQEDMDSALHYFGLAIEKDPDWAAPYAGLAMTWSALGSFSYAPYADAYQKGVEYLNKALEKDPNSANSHYVKAINAVWPGWDWEIGEKEFLTTLELNPNDALCRIYYAHLLIILHRSDEAVYQANLALKFDPLRPLVLGLYGAVMNWAGDHQSAQTQSEKALSIDPMSVFAISTLADSYLATGDTLKWYEAWKRQLYWTTEKYLVSLDSVFQEQGYLGVMEDRINVFEEVYSNGGVISFTEQAKRYLVMKNFNKAMDFYEKAYDKRHGFLAYISLDVMDYPELWENPRLIALLKKMNLPLPGD